MSVTASEQVWNLQCWQACWWRSSGRFYLS